MGARTTKTALGAAVAAVAVAACSGGGHQANPPATTTTSATVVPSPSTSSTTPSASTTPAHVFGQTVSIGGHRYAVTVTGPSLTSQMGSRSVPAGEGIVTFSLSIGDPTATSEPLTPFDANSSPADVHLVAPAGSSEFTCAKPGSIPGGCDVTGLQVEDDSAADNGSGQVGPGRTATIIYEESTVVASDTALSSLQVVVVDPGGPAPGYVVVKPNR